MFKRVLVTGAQSSLGRQVLKEVRRHASRAGLTVRLTGTGRSSSLDPEIGKALDDYVSCDLSCVDQVQELVAKARPDWIFHLARVGISAPLAADEWCEQTALQCLCHAVQIQQPEDQVRVVVAGSAAEIGMVTADDLPITEEFHCQPVSLYGLQKFHQTQWAVSQDRRQPLQLVVARIFNLIGPHLPATCASGRFARELALLQPGDRVQINTGPLTARRDYIDVRDAARALVQLVTVGNAGDIYNVCSGISEPLSSLCETLAEIVQASVDWNVDPRMNRANDVADVRGSAQKLQDLADWRPQIPLNQSLYDLIASVRPALSPLGLTVQ